MKDEEKSREQLIKELMLLRQRVADLREAEKEYGGTQDPGYVSGNFVKQSADSSTERSLAVGGNELGSKLKEPEDVPEAGANHIFWLATGDYSRILYVSSSYEHLWQRSRETLLEHPLDFLEAIHPDDIEEVSDSLERQKLGEITEKTYRIVHPDGSIRIIKDCAFPVVEQTGDVSRIVGIAEDITDRRRAEDALRKSEEKYRLAMDAVSDGLWDWDCRTDKVYYSPAWCQILSEDFVPPVYESWEDRIHPEERQEVLKSLKDHLAGQSVQWQQEHRLYTRSGEWKWVLGRGRVVARDDAGAPLRMVGTMVDISGRKCTEEAIAKERTFSEDIINSLPGIFYMYDEKGYLVRWNKKHEEVTGYSPGELLGMYVLDWFAEEHKQYILSRVKSVFSEGESSAEAPFLIKNGSQLPYFFTGRLATLDGHQYLLGLGIDITERRRAEEALRRSEKTARALLNLPNAAAFLIGPDGTVLDANETMKARFANMVSDIIGTSIWELFPPDVSRRRQAGFQEVLRTKKQVLYEDEREGTWSYAILSPILDEDHEISAVAVFAFDITERKRAEEALRKSEARLFTAIESLPFEFWMMDVDGHYVMQNSAFTKSYGNLVGRRLEDARMDKSTLEMWEENIHRASQGQFIETEVRLPSEAGDRFYRSIVAPVFDGDRIHGILGVNIDVTEQKLAEEEHQKLSERLQRAEKMEALGTLAGGVAHDLNNVLGVVVGYSELLLHEIEDESNPIRSFARGILLGGKRAAAIVQDLLTLARRGVPRRKVVNLNDVVLECRNSPEFEKLCSSHPDIQLKTDLEADILNISGSPVHLGKSLMNLMVNAAEAMPNGGTMTIQTRNRYLDKPISGYDEVREGDYVVLSVSDSGEGISAADLKRIFEPFYTKKVMGQSGTGLGLAVVWGTVKDHHGYVNVETHEGKGSTFTLYFPVTREELSPEQAPITAADYLGKGETILVVDDVKEQRELAVTMLTKLNYRVTSVSSGAEALEYLQGHAVDLVVLDMIMDPGMDGLDTYAKMIQGQPHQRAIIVSGYSETERVSRAQALGAGAYVRKPYVLEKLGLAVRNELDRRL